MKTVDQEIAENLGITEPEVRQRLTAGPLWVRLVYRVALWLDGTLRRHR